MSPYNANNKGGIKENMQEEWNERAFAHLVIRQMQCNDNQEQGLPSVCCYLTGQSCSFNTWDIISPVNADYVKEDATYPGTSRFNFTLTIKVSAWRVYFMTTPNQKRWDTTERYEEMEGEGRWAKEKTWVKGKSKEGQTAEAIRNVSLFPFLFLSSFKPPAPSVVCI